MIYHYFTVRVPQVGEVPAGRWKGYIKEAVESWAGQFQPVDGGYPDSEPGSGDPLGPPCEWNSEVQVRSQHKYKPDVDRPGIHFESTLSTSRLMSDEIIRRFEENGESNHSPLGGTLSTLLEHCVNNKQAFTLKYFPNVGWYLKKGAPLE